MQNKHLTPFAPSVLRLLQGPLYSDDTSAWKNLEQYYEQVRLYCLQMGLELQFHEDDGYAYLRQPDWEDDEGRVISLPHLTRRLPLGREISLLCILLREQLLLFETSNPSSSACILSREQIHELLVPALPERTNELQVQRRIDGLIEKTIELGFLRKVTRLEQDFFEVRRLLKAKINADQLVEVKERMIAHGAAEQ